MLSKNSRYDMDAALNEIAEKQLIVDAKIDTQVVLQLLIKNGIATREEVEKMRKIVSNSPKYRVTLDYLENAKEKARYYQQNPEQHLKDIMKAKLDGMN